MNPTSADPERLETLRARAEVLNDKLQKVSSQTDDEATKLLHELRTYQIELELQNDDLRQFQIALQELGDEYRELYDHAPVGYFLLDTRNKIVKANKTLTSLLDRPNLTDKPLNAIVHAEDQDELYRNLREFNTKTRHSFNVRLDTKSPAIWARFDLLAVTDERKERVLVHGTVTDISELKQAEHERHIIVQGMHKAQKLESLGVLAGGIAHDFNNLLMIVSGNVHLMVRELPEDIVFHKQLETIELASDRAAALCQHMLSYSGRGANETIAVDLNRAVADIMRLIESSVTNSGHDRDVA